MNFKVAIISIVGPDRKRRTMYLMERLMEVIQPPFIVAYDPQYTTVIIEIPEEYATVKEGNWITYGMYPDEMTNYKVSDISVFMPYYNEIYVILRNLGMVIR